MSETKVKEREMRTTYHCENCNVKFPAEDERFGMCRECNEGCGFCYECEKKDEKIFELESSNEKMLKILKEINQTEIAHPDPFIALKWWTERILKIVRHTIAKAEGK